MTINPLAVWMHGLKVPESACLVKQRLANFKELDLKT